MLRHGNQGRVSKLERVQIVEMTHHRKGVIDSKEGIIQRSFITYTSPIQHVGRDRCTQ
jgi:hypothetical protein